MAGRLVCSAFFWAAALVWRQMPTQPTFEVRKNCTDLCCAFLSHIKGRSARRYSRSGLMAGGRSGIDPRRNAPASCASRAVVREGYAPWGGSARDEHQRQGLYRRHLRAPDAACDGQDYPATPRRVGQGCARGRRPHKERHRRLFLRRRRHAGPRGTVDDRLSRPQAETHRFNRCRRLLLPAAGRSCRRGDRRRQMLDRADHARRPAARRGHGDRHGAAGSRTADAGIGVRAALRARDREHVRDGGDAPHAPVRHDQRADGLGQGRRLAPRAAQPTCDAARRRHGRGRRGFADDRRPVAPPRLLRHQ